MAANPFLRSWGICFFIDVALLCRLAILGFPWSSMVVDSAEARLDGDIIGRSLEWPVNSKVACLSTSRSSMVVTEGIAIAIQPLCSCSAPPTLVCRCCLKH